MSQIKQKIKKLFTPSWRISGTQYILLKVLAYVFISVVGFFAETEGSFAIFFFIMLFGIAILVNLLFRTFRLNSFLPKIWQGAILNLGFLVMIVILCYGTMFWDKGIFSGLLLLVLLGLFLGDIFLVAGDAPYPTRKKPQIT